MNWLRVVRRDFHRLVAISRNTTHNCYKTLVSHHDLWAPERVTSKGLGLMVSGIRCDGRPGLESGRRLREDAVGSQVESWDPLVFS